jgi:hypothetical protein
MSETNVNKYGMTPSSKKHGQARPSGSRYSQLLLTALTPLSPRCQAHIVARPHRDPGARAETGARVEARPRPEAGARVEARQHHHLLFRS